MSARAWRVGNGLDEVDVSLDAGVAFATDVKYKVGGLMRWACGRYGDAETGSNAGSRFHISRYSDAGAFLADCLIIDRDDGQWHVFGNMSISGTLKQQLATPTPTLSNTEMGFHALSNSQVRLAYRGTDGVLRTTTLNLT